MYYKVRLGRKRNGIELFIRARGISSERVTKFALERGIVTTLLERMGK